MGERIRHRASIISMQIVNGRSREEDGWWRVLQRVVEGSKGEVDHINKAHIIALYYIFLHRIGFLKVKKNFRYYHLLVY